MSARGGSRRRGGRRAEPPAAPAEVVRRRCDLAEAEVVPEAARPWRRLLRLDGEDASHVDLRDPTRIDFAYVRRFADLADELAPPRTPLDVLHLGGGALTLPRYVAATRPGSRQEVAEPDEALVALVRETLAPPAARDVRVRVRDGRALLERRRDASCDLVVLDAFVEMEVPAGLADASFAAHAARVLRPPGAVAANVVDGPDLARARDLGAHLAEAFAHVAVAASRKVVRGRQGGNVVLLGSAAALPVVRLAAKAVRGPAPEVVLGGEEARAWIAAAAS